MSLMEVAEEALMQRFERTKQMGQVIKELLSSQCKIKTNLGDVDKCFPWNRMRRGG